MVASLSRLVGVAATHAPGSISSKFPWFAVICTVVRLPPFVGVATS